MQEHFERLEKRIGYTFKDRELLEKALRHKSYAHEYPITNKFVFTHNERLEFLGDAVLQLVTAHLLWEKFPELPEGHLSKMRALLVNKWSLSQVASALKLGDYIFLGRGEKKSGGKKKDSILACAYEALLGAIYADSDLSVVKKIIEEHLKDWIQDIENNDSFRDYKSILQERVQKKFACTPQYKVCEEDGPDHKKSFEISVSVQGRVLAHGMGGSKKEAEQVAASVLLEKFPNSLETESTHA